MALWLGPPERLLALPDPDPGMSATVTRPTAEHTLLGGGRVIDIAPSGRSTFTLRWQRLTDDEYAILEQVYSGATGPGPFLLLPADLRWNYLSPVQGAATSATTDTTGWSVTGGEQLASTGPDVGAVLRGPRSLRWSLPSPTTSGRLAVSPPSGLPGWPAVPGLAWTWSCAARMGTTTGITVQAAAVLRWLDSSGADVSASSGPTVAVSPGIWAAPAVSAIRPATARYLLPEVRVEPATVTAATNVYLDTPQLFTGAAITEWVPGRGLPTVAFAELADRYPWADSHDCDATFLEVG